jgi:hypothetical protein
MQKVTWAVLAQSTVAIVVNLWEELLQVVEHLQPKVLMVVVLVLLTKQMVSQV